MTKLDDGGPAFPIPQQQFTDGVTFISAQGNDGMSLRDWFAGQALSGFLQRKEYDKETFTTAATDAYRYADAMLETRKKGTPDDHQ